MDGSVTPIQLRKKELHSDVVASAFQCFLMLHMFTYLFVQFGFFRTCVFALRLRYALPFMARFPGYSRWVACCMSLLPIMALPPYFLTPVFYV